MAITVSELLERQKTQASNHTPLPTFPEMKDLRTEPPHIAIVSCADPRVIPEQMFRLAPAEAVILRTVAGHPQPVLNDIVGLDVFLTLTDILVVHHTDCGATYFTNDSIREKLRTRLPDNREEVDHMEFGGVSDMEQSVKDDLNFLRTSPFIRTDLAERSRGFVYDIKTGELREVRA